MSRTFIACRSLFIFVLVLFSCSDKKVEITTHFYYISKDGQTYKPESNGTKAGIYLFYKNSSGKYVRVGSDTDSYDLRFTPNDGYRYIEDSNISTLSTKSLTN